MSNLAQQWVWDSGKTLQRARDQYDGCCIDFAGDCIDALGRGRLAYFEDIGDPVWRYHAAMEIDGYIHDLWIDDVLPTEQFLRKILGGGEVSYPAEEEDQPLETTKINII